MIIVFWLATLLLAWLWRQPWEFDKNLPAAENSYLDMVAPDGCRMVSSWEFKFSVIEGTDFRDSKRVLWTLGPDNRFNGRWLCPRSFVDNDRVICESFVAGTPSRENVEYLLFRRRFPEWWWGHFYRPEVWLLLALSFVLLFRATGAICARFRPNRDDVKISPAF